MCITFLLNHFRRQVFPTVYFFQNPSNLGLQREKENYHKVQTSMEKGSWPSQWLQSTKKGAESLGQNLCLDQESHGRVMQIWLSNRLTFLSKLGIGFCVEDPINPPLGVKNKGNKGFAVHFHVFLLCIIVRANIAVMKHCDQNQVGAERVFLMYTFTFQTITEGGYDKNSNRTGPGGRS